MSTEALLIEVGLKDDDVEYFLHGMLNHAEIPETDETVFAAILGFQAGIQAGMALEELRLIHGNLAVDTP